MDNPDRTHPDEMWQLGVLCCILVMQPERLSEAELRREMLVDEHDFSQVDECERAVRDLVASGLLRHDGDSVIPTRAAMRFAALNGFG
jgi:hypothetical protein